MKDAGMLDTSRPLGNLVGIGQSPVDAIVARAQQAIASEERRKATLGSRKLSRREKRARR